MSCRERATARTEDKPPLHAQIRGELLAEIESGRIAPGEQVPTEPELMSRFGVSRTTVRRALHDLESAGLLDRQPGRGTFVAEPRIEQELRRLTGFVEDMTALGLQASAEVLRIEPVPAERTVARQLRLRLGDKAMRFERVRLANLQPVSLDISYFPLELGQRIAQEDLRVNPFYSILEDFYGMQLHGADYVLEANVADEHAASALRVEVGHPILLIERTAYLTEGDVPVLFEYLHYRGDRMRYRLHVAR